LDGRTINYKNLLQQHGDVPATPFSYIHTSVPYEVNSVFRRYEPFAIKRGKLPGKINAKSGRIST